MPAIDAAEQTHRRAEEIEVTLKPFGARRLVASVYLQPAIKRLANLESPIPVEWLHIRGINGIFRPLPLRTLGDAIPHQAFQFNQPTTRDEVNMPGLQITARRRASCALEQIPHHCKIDRTIEESSDRPAAFYSFTDVQRLLPS